MSSFPTHNLTFKGGSSLAETSIYCQSTFDWWLNGCVFQASQSSPRWTSSSTASVPSRRPQWWRTHSFAIALKGSSSAYLHTRHPPTTGLQGEHLLAPAVERPTTPSAHRLQERGADGGPQHVPVSVEARPLLRQWEECQLPRRHPGQHSAVHLPQWRRAH